MKRTQGGLEIPVPTISEWLTDLSEQNKNRRIKEDFESWSHEVKKLYETLLKTAADQAEMGDRSVSYEIYLNRYESETYAKIPAILEYMRKVDGLKVELVNVGYKSVDSFDGLGASYLVYAFEGTIQISW